MRRNMAAALMVSVLLWVQCVQAVDEVAFFRPLHLADGTPDEVNGYWSGASAGLKTSEPDWDSGYYSAPHVADDFGSVTGFANMMVIRFRELFGEPNELPRVPVDATIVKAELNLNVWTGYGAPASVVRCFTGLTPWYASYYGVDTDFSTSAYRKWNAMEAWGGGTSADAPRPGIDYSDESVDVEVNFPPGSGTYSIDEYITFDVTDDIRAYLEGTLDNNGWWIGTNQALSAGKYQIGGMNSGWDLQPELLITWRIGPLTCEDLRPQERDPGDVNADCTVNLADVAIIGQNWMDCIDPEGCP